MFIRLIFLYLLSDSVSRSTKFLKVFFLLIQHDLAAEDLATCLANKRHGFQWLLLGFRTLPNLCKQKRDAEQNEKQAS